MSTAAAQGVRARVIVAAAMAAAGLVIATFLRVNWRIAFVIPVSGDRAYFPVPALFWLGMALYAVWCHRVFRQPVRATLAQAALIGVRLHLALLIVQQWMAAKTSGLQLPSVYAWSLEGVTLAWLVGLGMWSVLIVRRVSERRWPDLMACCVPVAHGLLLGYLAWFGFWTGVAVGLAPLLTLAWRPLSDAVPRAARAVRHGWNWLSSPTVSIWVIGLTALVVRLFYLARIMADPMYEWTGADGPMYVGWAQDWAHGVALMQKYEFIGSVGYVYFLGWGYRLFGDHHAPILLVQVLLGAGMCVLLSRLVRRLFDATTATLVGLVAALHFPLVFSSVAFGHQALDTVLSVVVLYGLVRYQEGVHPWRWLVLSAITAGVSAATREPSLLFFLFIPVWMFLVNRRAAPKQAVPHTAGFLAISLAVLGALVGPFVLKGAHLYSNQHILAMSFNKEVANLSNFGWNPFENPAAALATLVRHPLAVVWVMLDTVTTRLGNLFFAQNYGSFDPIFLVRESLYFYGVWWYAYLAFFIGLAVWWRRPPASWAALSLILGYLWWRLVPHLLFEAAYRYRPPMELALIMVAVSGAVWSYRTLKRHVESVRA